MLIGLGLWCLTPLSTIFQLYLGHSINNIFQPISQNLNDLDVKSNLQLKSIYFRCLPHRWTNTLCVLSEDRRYISNEFVTCNSMIDSYNEKVINILNTSS
jgi:hypothetical protein